MAEEPYVACVDITAWLVDHLADDVELGGDDLLVDSTRQEDGATTLITIENGQRFQITVAEDA